MCREGVEGCCHVVAGSVFVSIRNSFVEEGGRGVFFYIPTCINMLGGGVVIVLCVGGDGVCMCPLHLPVQLTPYLKNEAV